MKMSCILHYVLSILEGALAGGCFYHARQAEQAKKKGFLMAASVLWFGASVTNSLLGGRELREMIKQMEETNND